MNPPSISKTARSIYCLKNVITLNVAFLFTLLVFSNSALSQCIASPTVPSCSPAGSSALVNNDVVVAGQIKTVSGTLSYNGLSMSGGTLIVCGSLSLTAINFTSGTIIINPGGNLYINPGTAIVFGSNCSIYNFGTFKITTSLVTGQNNIIYNVSTTAAFIVAFNQFIIQGPNTYVVNNGALLASYIIVQPTNSAGPICSGPGSFMVCNFMINQYSNAFLSPSGPSCINITQQVINNQPMTSTSNVNICYLSTSVSIIGPANFGSATVNSNCPSCSVALPIELKNFTGNCINNTMKLQWATALQTNVKEFVIEGSVNAVNFSPIATVSGRNYKATQTSYEYEFDISPNESTQMYYRLKQVEMTNKAAYSPVIYAKCTEGNDPLIYPSVTESEIHVTAEAIESVTLYDLAGRLIYSANCNNSKTHTLSMDVYARGMYLVTVRADNKAVTKKIILR